MSIIEQATKRLEELQRAGVAVPWDAAGLGRSELKLKIEGRARVPVDAVREESRQATTPRQSARPVASLEPPAKIDVTIDLPRLEEAGYLVPTQTRSLLAEEFRQIKAPLLKNARSKDAAMDRLALIMVTSALPGEGKTFSAVNLALSIATEIDLSVLLIDADVVRPDAMTRLGVENNRGLIDLLSDESLDLNDLVLSTNIPKLSLLPAGRHSHLSTELLASAAMDTFLSRLATEYPAQVVVFDAPPLLLTSEAKVLASRVGQVVVVVEAERTQRANVKEAFAAVEQCPIVMSMLNKSRRKEVAGGYTYGYYYGPSQQRAAQGS
jgi:protein-tyrosine kinase